MHRRMAAGAPASSLTQVQCMIDVTDVYLPAATVLNLGMALQAQVQVTLDEQLSID